MVVISIAVETKNGKVLVARNFVPITKSRIEALLSSFPKLIGTGTDAQHTFHETDQVRYLYQPLEQLYIVMITTKQSNIMEDLETLRLLSKLVVETAGGQSEEFITAKAFELVHSFDEIISVGYKENVTLQQIKSFIEMDSHEEKLQRIILDSKMKEASDLARSRADAIERKKMEAKRLQLSYGSQGNVTDNNSMSSEDNHYRNPTPAFQPATTPVVEKRAPSITNTNKAAENKPKVKGMQLTKAQKSDDFFAQINKEETVQAGRAPAAVAASPAPKQSVCVVIDEKLVVQLEREGGLKAMEVKGEMKLCIYDPDDARIVVHTSGLKESDGFKCRLHPKVNKQVWSNNNAICLQDNTKSFPVGSDNAPIVLKWRKVVEDEQDVPISLNFWPNVENGQTVVSVEYSMEKDLELQNVVIDIPCPSNETPEITSHDGQYKYDQRSKILSWIIGDVNSSNGSGSLEFQMGEVDSDAFFPININFSSTQTLSNLQISSITNLADNSDKEFSATYALGVEKYTVE